MLHIAKQVPLAPLVALATLAELLAPSVAHPTTFLSGPLPSSLPLSGSPYVALTDLTLDNRTSTAEPGVVLSFTAGKRIILRNATTLQFVGTQGQPIILQGEGGAAWGGITLLNDTPGDAITATHTFTWVQFSGASSPSYKVRFFNNGSSVSFANCTVAGGGLDIEDGTPGGYSLTLQNVSMAGSSGAGLQVSGDDGLDVVVVDGCTVSGFTDGAILDGVGVTASNLSLHDNGTGLRTTRDPDISSSLITNNTVGVVVSGPTSPTTFPQFTQVRVVGNVGVGVHVDVGGNCRFTGCLLHDNGGAHEVEVFSNIFDVTTLDFQGCYWGKTITQEMITEGSFSDIARILDWWDDNNKSLVDFDGFLTPGFVDATTAPLDNSGAGTGASWVDCDNDSDLDLYLAKDLAQSNMLLRNNGGLSFAVVASSGAENNSETNGMTWGDYDNDGLLDVYVVNRQSPNKLFRNTGAGHFVDATVAPLAFGDGDQGATWVDYDRDGWLDLFLTTGPGVNDHLYHNLGGGTFADATPAALQLNAAHGTSSAWGDYDNDGDRDVFVSVQTGADRLIRNDGGGAFTDVTVAPLNDPGTGQGAAWGDYDNDGDLDLFVCNFGTADRLFRNDGGSFVDVATGPLADPNMGQSGTWADFDNDRDLDLALTNFGQASYVLRNDGGNSFVQFKTIGTTAQSLGAAWGDCDDDGDLDLYVSNYGSANRLFRNDQFDDGNKWLRLDLRGTASNRAGIGARVRVVTGSVIQMQEVGANEGFWSHNSTTAEFGLGTATAADSVTIRWPSGILQALTNVAAGQRLTIVEAANPVAALSLDGSFEFRLHAGFPNPFHNVTHILYEVPRLTAVSLRVYDVQGRLVRTLEDARREPGSYSVIWDGRTSAGDRAAAGVYFYRLDAGDLAQTRKVVFVR